MNRRKFLLESAMSAPLLLSASSIFSSCGDLESLEPNGKKVIVIGAGISGLAAANNLKNKGFEVVVLEAQSKPGGRILTDRTLGFPFDMGASWIHGPSGNPLTKIANSAGATSFLTDDNSVEVFDINGTSYNDSIIDKIESQYYNALKTVIKSGRMNESFKDVFVKLYPDNLNDRLWKFMLSSYLEFDIGGDISRISSKYFDDDEVFGGRDQIITNGFDKITNFLSQGLDIRLNSKVTEVDYIESTLKVKTNGIYQEADFVLVTIPLGVLKSNSITFNPALPEKKLEAISSTEMGVVNKFVMIWHSAFWDVNLQYIGYTPETKGKFNYFLNIKKFSNINGLMAFTYGDFAEQTENMSDGEVKSLIMENLKSIYGNDIPDPIQFMRTKWGKNEYAYGSYSFATTGTTTEDFDIMAKDVDGKLFFAGEHTNRMYRGAAHGAYLSGIREADKIYTYSKTSK